MLLAAPEIQDLAVFGDIQALNRKVCAAMLLARRFREGFGQARVIEREPALALDRIDEDVFAGLTR